MSALLAWVHAHADLAFVIFLTANALLTAFVILLENREPEKSIAWMLALLLFPLIGFIFYLFFGRDWHKHSYQQKRLNYALTAKRRQDLDRLAQKLLDATPLERNVRLLDAHMTDADPTEGNRIRVLTDAHEKYPRLATALRAAKHSIDLEYYIFRDDVSGREVLDIMKERAQHGVNVRMLVDGMGSFGFGAKHFRDLRAAGVHCHYFSPLITLFYFLKANYRDHRKIVVVDDEVAFTGGINIGDEYLGKSDRGTWRDTSLELRGPCVIRFSELFEDAWRRTTKKKLKTEFREPPVFPGGERVDVVASGPDGAWKTIHQQYLALIHGATRRVRIQTPYFIPDEALQNALIQSALRGVNIELMLPRYPDWPYLRWAAQTYFSDLLRAGVRIFEYRVGFLHTKAVIVDDILASVGTCNVDIRSLRLDFEVNVLVSGSGTVRHLTEDFERDLLMCDEVRFVDFIDRPLWKRLVQSLARLVSPLL